MNVRLKPIDEQVIVVTGASSETGVPTAREAARRGACVVLADRDDADLAATVQAIRAEGGRAVHQAADVADAGQVERIAATALREFGRIDGWVNISGIALHGSIADTPLDDMRRRFDALYWGGVHGSRAAVRHMREAGGALINVTTALADRAMPPQGSHRAAVHAVRAMTDALRLELEAEGVPISVTLIEHASVHAPRFDAARSDPGDEPRPVSPVRTPDAVAHAILEAAQRPIRELTVAGERGAGWTGRVTSSRVYVSAKRHPTESGLLALGVLGVAAGLLAARGLGGRNGRSDPARDALPPSGAAP